jgi:hypothetical protein
VVPPFERIHPEVARAAFALVGLPYAEAWRRLSAVASAVGERPPSYHYVRLLMRTIGSPRWEPTTDPVADLLTGRVPWAWLDQALAGSELAPPS